MFLFKLVVLSKQEIVSGLKIIFTDNILVFLAHPYQRLVENKACVTVSSKIVTAKKNSLAVLFLSLQLELICGNYF